MTLERMLKSCLIHILNCFTEIEQYDFLKACLDNTKTTITAEKMLEMDRYIHKRPDLQFYWDLTEIAINDLKNNLDLYTNIYIEFFKNQYIVCYQEVMQIPESEVVLFLKKYMDKLKGNTSFLNKEIYSFICFLYRFKKMKNYKKVVHNIAFLIQSIYLIETYIILSYFPILMMRRHIKNVSKNVEKVLHAQ